MSQEPVRVSTHFEVELLVPRLHSRGSRWKHHADQRNLAEAMEYIDDIHRALAAGGMSVVDAYDWVRTNVRAVEVTTTVERGTAHFYQH